MGSAKWGSGRTRESGGEQAAVTREGFQAGGRTHADTETGERRESADDLGGPEGIGPGKQPTTERREPEGVDDGEIDVAPVADDPLVEGRYEIDRR